MSKNKDIIQDFSLQSPRQKESQRKYTRVLGSEPQTAPIGFGATNFILPTEHSPYGRKKLLDTQFYDKSGIILFKEAKLPNIQSPMTKDDLQEEFNDIKTSVSTSPSQVSQAQSESPSHAPSQVSHAPSQVSHAPSQASHAPSQTHSVSPSKVNASNSSKSTSPIKRFQKLSPSKSPSKRISPTKRSLYRTSLSPNKR